MSVLWSEIHSLLVVRIELVLFCLHGRLGSLSNVVPWCEQLAAHATSQQLQCRVKRESERRKRKIVILNDVVFAQLLIAAVEQRNHGRRIVDEAMVRFDSKFAHNCLLKRVQWIDFFWRAKIN
jgi:hypothetical protein